VNQPNERRDKIVEKIRKLFSVTTEAGATQAEMESAIARAEHLMAEYAIEAFDLQGRPADGSSLVEESILEGKGLFSQAIMASLPLLEHALAVKTMVVMKYDFAGQQIPANQKVYVLGDRVQVDAARWLLSYLEATLEGLWTRHTIARQSRNGQKDYYSGIIAGVVDRIKFRKRGAMLTGSGKALAVVEKNLKDEMDRRHPDTELLKRDVNNASAFFSGYSDSSQVSLDPAVGGDRVKSIRSGG
jgi:hypothetical protein